MIRKHLLAFVLLFVVRETSSSSNGLHLPLNLEFSSSGSPLSISFSQNTEAVVLGEPLIIRCHVNTRSKEAELITRSSMNLYCPLRNKTTFCFQNCQAGTVCRENGGASCRRILGLGDVACRIFRQEDHQLVYEYTIPRLTADWLAAAGDDRGFSCSSGGQSTQTIQLHQRRRFHATDSAPATATTTTSTTTTTTTASPTVAVITTTGNGLVAGVRRNPSNTETSPFVEYLEGSPLGRAHIGTITFIALIALALSVLINIFCCIRCVLIRQYISSDSRALMKSCCCMKKEIMNGRAGRKYSKHSTPDPGAPEAHWSTAYAPSRGGGPCFQLLPDAVLQPDAANSDESFALDGRMQRVRPEGKANNSTMSNSGGRSNSVSGISLPPSVQLYTASGQPVVWAQPWPPSDPQTPSSLQPKHHHRSSQVIGTPVLCLNAAAQYAAARQQQPPAYPGLATTAADCEAYDASQRSLIVSPTMMMMAAAPPGSRMSRVFAAPQDLRSGHPHHLQRTSSKETILSGLVIQSPPPQLLQEMAVLGGGPDSSVSEAVSEKTSSDLGGRKGGGGPMAMPAYPAYYQLPEGYGQVVDRAHPMGASQPHLSSNLQYCGGKLRASTPTSRQYTLPVAQNQMPPRLQVESRADTECSGQFSQQEPPPPAAMMMCPTKTKELEENMEEKDVGGQNRDQLRGPTNLQRSPSQRLRQQWTKQWTKDAAAADLPNSREQATDKSAFLYCKTILSNKLAESVNTEDELPSDWSDRDTALGTEKESHSSSAAAPRVSAEETTARPLLTEQVD